MPRPRVAPGRLRRRLTIAFTLAGGLAAATLAASSYLVVRDARLDDSVETALEQTRFNLLLASDVLAAGEGTDALLSAYERRGEFTTVGVGAETSFSSSVSPRAESITIGTPLSRLISRQTSRPSRPGSITSRSTRSYEPAR
jgi:hypothetical protein